MWILDERSPQQIDRGILFSGFTHENCRIRWNQKFKPSKTRRITPLKKNASLPTAPPPVHVNDHDDREKELRQHVR